LGTGDAGRST